MEGVKRRKEWGKERRRECRMRRGGSEGKEGEREFRGGGGVEEKWRGLLLPLTSSPPHSTLPSPFSFPLLLSSHRPSQ
jgi:hypothetical protein